MNPASAQWRKSSRSANSGSGNCVEVASNLTVAVGVRDSKDRTGPALAFPHVSWATFVTAVKDGEFDL